MVAVAAVSALPAVGTRARARTAARGLRVRVRRIVAAPAVVARVAPEDVIFVAPSSPSSDDDDFDASSSSSSSARRRLRTASLATLSIVAAATTCCVHGAPPAWAGSGSEGGRHGRSKLREKEERYERESSRGGDASHHAHSAGGGNGGGDRKPVSFDDGKLVVDLKSPQKAVESLGQRVKRAHRKAKKAIKKRVDKTLRPDRSRAATYASGDQASFRTARGGPAAAYYDSGPPPWVSGLVGWAGLFAVAYAVIRVFGLAPRGGGGLSLPSFGGGGSRRKPPRGSGPGRWVKDRTLGGREIWVEDAFARGTRGNALSGSLEGLGAGSGLSEAAAKERRRREAKEAAERAASADATEPSWWSRPPPGYCPESAREERLIYARSVLAALSAKRVSGVEYDPADLVALRDACQAANASVSDRVRPESARSGIFKAAVEFALDAASQRSTTGVVGVPAQFLAGIAEDVGVPPGKAGRTVAAGVAARTRRDLLQAGAQRRQGDDGGAMMTLDGIIGVLDAFPPGSNSAEFEMIADGLALTSTLEERAGLLKMFQSIGGGGNDAAIAEALGVGRDWS